MYLGYSESVVPRSRSVQKFEEHQAEERWRLKNVAVSEQGFLLEHSTLALRVNPPKVEIDNRSHERETIITIDSANRPGTLVEVVQCLTELNLVVKSAQISSDGGWFADVFYVTELTRAQVYDERKLETIRKVLDIEYECEKQSQESPAAKSKECTVFEMSGCDQSGLLHKTTKLLTENGLDVRSLAAWTQKGRGAIVIAAQKNDAPLQDPKTTAKIRKDLVELLSKGGIVNIKTVEAEKIHHERRLHRLLLQEVERNWEEAQHKDEATGIVVVDENGSVNGKVEEPQVTITDWDRMSYWRVEILCQDRPKLFFDTLCTLADMDYDVYHATVKSAEGAMASQDFYVRPGMGDVKYNEPKAQKLKHMLISSIKRRFPKGLKLHVLTTDEIGLLARITELFTRAGFWVTRAKVTTPRSTISYAVHTFYIVDKHDNPLDPHTVRQVMTESGGKHTQDLDEDRQPHGELELKKHQFYFSVKERRQSVRMMVGSPGNSM